MLVITAVEIEERIRKVAKMGDQMIGKIERESSRRGKLMYSWSRAPSGCWAGGKEKKSG